MTSLSCEEVLRWSGGELRGDAPDVFSGISKDTRDLKAGTLYVAIQGEVHDGHAFLTQACKAGAAGALVSRDAIARHECPEDIPLVMVEDTLQALWALAEGYRSSLDVQTIAVTGSSGKTTVKELAWACCSVPGPTARTQGNFNNHIGVPFSLLAMPRDARIGVFEAGMNHPGELNPLCRMIKPNVGIVTNVGPVHLAHFPDVQAIALEKAEVLKCLPSDGLAVLHKDDRHYEFLHAQSPCPVASVSTQQDADYFGSIEPDGTMSVIEHGSDVSISVPLPVPGEHNAINLLLSLAAARFVGQSWEDILVGAQSYAPPPMRWEKSARGDVLFINDAYNANPMSMMAAINTFVSLPGDGRRWLVLGGMFELGVEEEDHHRKLGNFIGTHDVHGVITVGSHGEWIIDGIRQSADDQSPVMHNCGTTKEAAEILDAELRAGDHVLLKGSRGARLENVLDSLTFGSKTIGST